MSLRPGLPDLVIFDCDGTLVDTEALHQKTLVDMLNGWGGAFTVSYAEENFAGKSHAHIFKTAHEQFGTAVPDDAFDAYISAFTRAGAGQIPAIPDAVATVQMLAEQTKVCVASNGMRASVLSSLEGAGLMPPFKDDQVFTAADVTHGKPAPDLFIHAAKMMGCDPAHDRIVVIEDSIAGVTAGIAAGMETYWLCPVATACPPQLATAIRHDTMRAIRDCCLKEPA